MGMYTQLIFSAGFSKNMPEEIANVIKYMCTGENKPDKLPNHILFNTDRWESMLMMSSYYFPDSIKPQFRKDSIDDQWRLTSVSNLKNYNSEIEKFIDWLSPYIVDGSGYKEFFAIVCYEEQEVPTIYYLNE